MSKLSVPDLTIAAFAGRPSGSSRRRPRVVTLEFMASRAPGRAERLQRRRRRARGRASVVIGAVIALGTVAPVHADEGHPTGPAREPASQTGQYSSAAAGYRGRMGEDLIRICWHEHQAAEYVC